MKYPSFSFWKAAAPALAIAAIALLPLTPVSAQVTMTWNPGGAGVGSGNWSLNPGDTNWNNGSANVTWTTTSTSGVADKAVFGGADGTAGQYVVTLSSNVSVGTIPALNFQSSGYIIQASNNQTISFSSTYVNETVNVSAGKTAEIGSKVTLAFNQTTEVNGGGTLNVSGRLQQNTNNGFVISGNSTLNFLAGGSGLVQGSWQVGSTTDAGRFSQLIVSGGNVTMNQNGSNLVLANVSGLTSAANLTISSGSLLMTGTTSTAGIRFASTTGNASTNMTGVVNLDGGTLQTNRFFEGSATGNISSTVNFNGGILKLGNNATTTNYLGVDNAIVKAGGARIDTNGQSLSLSNNFTEDPLSTGGGFEKRGAGTLTLTAVNGFTGNTTVTEGTLVLSSTGSVASSTLGFGVKDATNGLLTVQNAGFSFSGNLTLDLATVTVSSGSWTLFNGAEFGAGDLNLADLTSNLVGLSFSNSSGVWSGTDLSSRTWTFTEDSGVLQVVPEPTTWALVGLGLGATLFFRRRKD